MTTIEQQRERLRRLAEEEYRQKLEAIDWVLQNTPMNGTPVAASKVKARGGITPSLPLAVKEIVPQMDGDFDRDGLVATIKATYPSFGKIASNYLRVLLGKLVKEKVLKVTVPGGGKRLTRYSYIGD